MLDGMFLSNKKELLHDIILNTTTLNKKASHYCEAFY